MGGGQSFGAQDNASNRVAAPSNRDNGQANLVEAKLKRTREELDKAREEIVQKDGIIKKFREW